jgi:RNA polymerase sigma-70 factor (ECF subfamily)
MNSASDSDLMARIREGNVEALGCYLELHKHRLLGFLRHITGEHLLRVMDLDDLFQEVSQSAVQALPRIPKDDLQVDKWLEQLARRRVVDAHRQHFGAAKRAGARNQIFSQMALGNDSHSPGFEQMLIASMTSPSMAVSRNWRMLRMQQAISELDAEQQQMLQMRYVDGLPTAKIAEALNKSDGAVRVTLSRILAKLQQTLGEPPQND